MLRDFKEKRQILGNLDLADERLHHAVPIEEIPIDPDEAPSA
jgi:hypothetical protein